MAWPWRFGRVDLQQHRLRQRDQPGPANPAGPEEDEFPKAGGAPHSADATVKLATEARTRI